MRIPDRQSIHSAAGHGKADGQNRGDLDLSELVLGKTIAPLFKAANIGLAELLGIVCLLVGMLK